MILTTSEAAAELGITPFGVRKLVERGRLAPIAPGAHPMRFRLLDVADAQEQQMTKAMRATLDKLAAVLAQA